MSTETTTTNTNKTNEENGAKKVQNFRSNVDVENFYRFVHENDLRREAKMLLSMVYSRMTDTKKKKGRKKKLH